VQAQQTWVNSWNGTKSSWCNLLSKLRFVRFENHKITQNILNWLNVVKNYCVQICLHSVLSYTSGMAFFSPSWMDAPLYFESVPVFFLLQPKWQAKAWRWDRKGLVHFFKLKNAITSIKSNLIVLCCLLLSLYFISKSCPTHMAWTWDEMKRKAFSKPFYIVCTVHTQGILYIYLCSTLNMQLMTEQYTVQSIFCLNRTKDDNCHKK